LRFRDIRLATRILSLGYRAADELVYQFCDVRPGSKALGYFAVDESSEIVTLGFIQLN
jgi:hypothetical protein